MTTSHDLLLLLLVCVLLLLAPSGWCEEGGEQVRTVVNSSVVLNCPLNYPHGEAVPYIINWEKEGLHEPVYIHYDGYDPHESEGYKGRVSRVTDPRFGRASLNLSRVVVEDRGCYRCKVLFLDRSPEQKSNNGTRICLEVHAPPRLLDPPREINYVKLGEDLILSCVAEGNPPPRIEWFKDSGRLMDVPGLGIGKGGGKTGSQGQGRPRVRIANDGMELRISDIRAEDLGDYTCLAKNDVHPHASALSRVMLAGAARILTGPRNVTLAEGNTSELTCEARGQPSNITVQWYQEGTPVERVQALASRYRVTRNGSLVIHPVTAEDAGAYTCEVTNGIGGRDSASAYLNVEFRARVLFAQSPQYLPFRMSGMIHCPVEANPPLQWVSWLKDSRMFDPKAYPEVIDLNNGSLLFQQVKVDHQGEYRCTPYNVMGTKGHSPLIQVLVREPPSFQVAPKPQYEAKVDGSVTMHCLGAGEPNPTTTWRRCDGRPMPGEGRARLENGELRIGLLKPKDHGCYECVVGNEVTRVVRTTQLVVRNTPPHAPHNVSVDVNPFSATVAWIPGYSGGDEEFLQYVVWYRKADNISKWITSEVQPSKALRYTVYGLEPNTSYEFQVSANNQFGHGFISEMVEGTTPPASGPTRPTPPTYPPVTHTLPTHLPKPSPGNNSNIDYSIVVLPTDATGATYIPTVINSQGPRPGAPRNVTAAIENNHVVLRWVPPFDNHLVAVAYYTVELRTDDDTWRALSEQIQGATQFRVEEFLNGQLYTFRVTAHTLTSQTSTEIPFLVPPNLKSKAITAGIVGGVLFFIVAIILSICAVRICHHRKRRQQEKAYNMVACRVTDARNGGHPASPVPFNKVGDSRVSVVMTQMAGRLSSLAGFLGVESKEEHRRRRHRKRTERRNRFYRYPHYSVQVRSPPSWIGRGGDGKFVADGGSTSSSDDGGFIPRSPPPPTWHTYEPVETGMYHVGGPHSTWGYRHSQASETSGGELLVTPFPSPPFTIYTPDGRRFRTSSPPPRWKARGMEVSDLSSVRQPSSAERSFPSTVPSRSRLFPGRIPSLRPIYWGDTTPLSSRFHQVQVQVHHHDPAGTHFFPPPPPSVPAPRHLTMPIYQYPYPYPYPYVAYPYPIAIEVRPRRHLQPPRIPDIPPAGEAPLYANVPRPVTTESQRPLATSSPPGTRPAKRVVPVPPGFPPPSRPQRRNSAPDLRPRIEDSLTETGEASSSGFGSKNTSSQQTSSQSHSGMDSSSPPPLLSPQQQLDASVDDHYEFDSIQLPETDGGRTAFEDRGLSDSEIYIRSRSPADPKGRGDNGALRPEDREARLRAMREEFQLYRQRQAQRSRGPVLESSC